jgi:hypothetical protein
MTLRRVRFSAVAMVLFTVLLSSVVPESTGRGAAVLNRTTTGVASWTFEGCWTQFSAGTCRDVFVDQQGQHWICRECGTTGKPGPGKCSPISEATLASGFWCS